MISLVHLLCVTEDPTASCRSVSKAYNIQFSKQIVFCFILPTAWIGWLLYSLLSAALLSLLIFFEVILSYDTYEAVKYRC